MKQANGALFKRLRMEKKLTQQALSKKLNLSNSVISAIERGERGPSLKTFEVYSKFFEIPQPELTQEYYALTTGEFRLNEEQLVYNALAASDVEILSAIKADNLVYDRIMKQPKRTVELLHKAIEMAEFHVKQR